MVSREIRIGQLFVELADTLTADFDVVEFMHRLADACLELLDVDMAGLMLIDVRGRPRLIASSPDLMRDLELFELQADEGPCVDVIETGKSVVNIKVAEAKQRWPRFTAVALEAGMRSTHALPLKLRADLIGAVNLFGKSEQRLSEGDIALSQALADVASIGLLQQRAPREPAMLAEQLQSTLNTRILVEQAKGILAEHSRLSPGDTFHFLRAHARATRETMQVVAGQVVSGELTSTEIIPASPDAAAEPDLPA